MPWHRRRMLTLFPTALQRFEKRAFNQSQVLVSPATSIEGPNGQVQDPRREGTVGQRLENRTGSVQPVGRCGFDDAE